MLKHLLLFLHPLLTPRNQPQFSVAHGILKNNAASTTYLTAASSVLPGSWSSRGALDNLDIVAVADRALGRALLEVFTVDVEI
jgi:hypothetical protein